MICRECGCESGEDSSNWYSVDYGGMTYWGCPKHRKDVYRRFIDEIVKPNYRTAWWDDNFNSPHFKRCHDCFTSQWIAVEEDLMEWYLDGEDNSYCEECFEKRI